MMCIKGKKGQTALELAVFGAILIFVMGGIIQSVMGRALQQHAFLKATRLALTLSHTSTETKLVSGRNMGSVLFVEDRLAASSSKYGSIDRMPFMTQGTGIHSANLFMPVWFGDQVDLPVVDVFVNGKHFAFTTAGFKTVFLANSCANANPCPDDCVDGADTTGPKDCGANSPYYYRAGIDVDGDLLADDVNGDGVPDEMDWEPQCLEATVRTTQTFSCADTSSSPPFCFPPAVCDYDPPYECPDPSCSDCSRYSIETYTQTLIQTVYIGCAKLYTVVDNHPKVDDWCNGGLGPLPRRCEPTDPDPAGEPSLWPAACSTAVTQGCNLSADERFNLDRASARFPEGLDWLPGTVDVPDVQRPGFAWQWFLVAPVDASWRDTRPNFSANILSMAPPAGLVTQRSARLLMAEGIVLPGGENKPQNISLDVDYDLKLENIMPNVEDGPKPNVVDNFGIIRQIGVTDFQMGDVDFTFNESDELRGLKKYGFTKDVTLYTFVRPSGTYLRIDEGKLYLPGDSKQYVRTASRKEQVDLIERIFQMNNNTGGYCPGGNAAPVGDPVFRGHYGIFDNSTPNPVEVCTNEPGGCYVSGNINKTCMDTEHNTIYIRSRIEDLHGRKWITDESTDPYVNLVIE